MATLQDMMSNPDLTATLFKPFEDAAKEAQRQRESRRDALITMAANRMLPKGMTIDMGGGMSFGNKVDPTEEIDMQTKIANLAQTQKQTELLGVEKKTVPKAASEEYILTPETIEKVTAQAQRLNVPVADLLTKYGATQELLGGQSVWTKRKAGTLTEAQTQSAKDAQSEETRDALKAYRDGMLSLKNDAQKSKETAENKEVTKVKSILYKTSELVAKDNNFNDVTSRLKAFQNIDVMLEENLGNAKGFIVRQMIIASGDKRPSDKDAKAFGTSPQLFKKLEQNWNTIAKGTFTDFNKDELLQMSELAKGLSLKQARAVIDSKYENYDVNYGDVLSSDKAKAVQYRYLDRLAGVSSATPSGGASAELDALRNKYGVK